MSFTLVTGIVSHGERLSDTNNEGIIMCQWHWADGIDVNFSSFHNSIAITLSYRMFKLKFLCFERLGLCEHEVFLTRLRPYKNHSHKWLKPVTSTMGNYGERSEGRVIWYVPSKCQVVSRLSWFVRLCRMSTRVRSEYFVKKRRPEGFPAKSLWRVTYEHSTPRCKRAHLFSSTVLQVRELSIPLPPQQTQFTVVLDNGIHFVTTPESALSLDARIDQEFEL